MRLNRVRIEGAVTGQSAVRKLAMGRGQSLAEAWRWAYLKHSSSLPPVSPSMYFCACESKRVCCIDWSFPMKKLFTCLLMLSLFISAFVFPLTAQTRVRRVGQNPTPPVPNASTPSRPPVLGGASTTAGQEKVQSPTTNSGPEEVGAGDVIRVETTLVTLPVSVTDRNGRYIPDLIKEDFRLWEDGVEQQVAFFS